MRTVLGPNTRGVLHLISHLRRLDAQQVDAVAENWKRQPARVRARARAAAVQAATGKQRVGVLAAAELARDVAMSVASRYDRTDWAFWAAAWDAAAGVAVGGLIDDQAYQQLVGPLASVIPWLAVGRQDRLDVARLQAALGQWRGAPT